MKIERIIGGNLGVNCYILENNKEILLIDFVPEVERFIKNNNYNLKIILLTHIHFDHFEMLFDFQKRFVFKLGLSRYGYERINDKYYNLLENFPDEITRFIQNVDLTNTFILNDREKINFNDIEIETVYTPGHSEDSVSFIIHSEKIVFTGDTIFNGSIGRTDLPGSNEKGIFNSIKKLFSLINDDYILYPGHGDKTSVLQEKKYNFFIKAKI